LSDPLVDRLVAVKPAPWVASCIRIAKPSCRVPTTVTAISQVSGLGHSATSAMAAAMVPQAWATSHMPRHELREVKRLHSSGENTVFGSMRFTAGMGG
jgi:homoserine kinase